MPIGASAVMGEIHDGNDQENDKILSASKDGRKSYASVAKSGHRSERKDRRDNKDNNNDEEEVKATTMSVNAGDDEKSDPKKHGKGESEEADLRAAADSPGWSFMAMVTNEHLLDKLKILNYESDLAPLMKSSGFRGLPRHYFAAASHPGQQFFMFVSVAAWLIRQTGRKMNMPEEHEDPNSLIAQILDHLRKLSKPVDFPPNKLKSGSGEHVLVVLDRLADEALLHGHFSWEKPRYPAEAPDDEEVVEDDPEIDLNNLEQDMDAFNNDIDDDEGLIDLEALKLQQDAKETEGSKLDNILESNVDSHAWKMELERVLPTLKVTLKLDGKDWRTHIDQMHNNQGAIEKYLAETSAHLTKLSEDINRTLEKINSREKYVNQSLEHTLLSFRQLQDRLAEKREAEKTESASLDQLSAQLTLISTELDKVKQEMEEKGANMTNGEPLVRIKQAHAKLKKEIVDMDIRLGVLDHMLIVKKLREKRELQKLTSSGGGATAAGDGGSKNLPETFV